MARILIVDDEESILKSLTVLLRAEGYETVSSLGGQEARNLIIEEDFDLLISDLRMVPVSGMELLKLAHEVRPNLMVIMLTAYGQVETAIEALQLGAFDYIKKPFSTVELVSTVKRALESRNYMKTSPFARKMRIDGSNVPRKPSPPPA